MVTVFLVLFTFLEPSVSDLDLWVRLFFPGILGVLGIFLGVLGVEGVLGMDIVLQIDGVFSVESVLPVDGLLPFFLGSSWTEKVFDWRAMA